MLRSIDIYLSLHICLVFIIFFLCLCSSLGCCFEFLKPIGEPPPVVCQSDLRKLGSGCKKYMAERTSSDSSKETNTMILAPLSKSSALSVRRSKALQQHSLSQQRCRPTSARTWLPPPLIPPRYCTPHWPPLHNICIAAINPRNLRL